MISHGIERLAVPPQWIGQKLTGFVGFSYTGQKRPSGKWLLPVPVANPLATKKTPAAGRWQSRAARRWRPRSSRWWKPTVD